MSAVFNSPKKNWVPVIERVVLFLAAVVTVIGGIKIIPPLLNSPNVKTAVPIQKPRPSPHIVQPPANTPTSKSIFFSKDIVVLIAANDNKIDWTLSSTIASLLKKRGLKITTSSLFNNSFLTSGGFARLFDGSSLSNEVAHFPRYFKVGVFGKKNVAYVKNDDFTNLITATMTLELHVISSQSGGVQWSISFTQNGAGFSNASANKNAEEKIIQEVETQLSSIVNHLGN